MRHGNGEKEKLVSSLGSLSKCLECSGIQCCPFEAKSQEAQLVSHMGARDPSTWHIFHCAAPLPRPSQVHQPGAPLEIEPPRLKLALPCEILAMQWQFKPPQQNTDPTPSDFLKYLKCPYYNFAWGLSKCILVHCK